MVTLLFSGCVTAPVVEKPTPVGSAFGQWRGQGSASRTVVKEGSSRIENWTFNLEIVSRTPGYGRIEITGAMGVYGGTIAWNEKQTKILLPGQRKFIVAPNSDRAFTSILPVPISPAMVESVIFDRKFESRVLREKNLNCQTLPASGEKESIEKCTGPRGLAIERSRGSEMATLSVKTSDSTVKMQLRPVRAKVEERSELWQLDSPRGFRVIDTTEEM